MTKKILIWLSLFLAAAPFGYCRESAQPLRLTIQSDKKVYEAGEEIALEVTIANLSSDELYILPLIESSQVILDYKQYGRDGAFGWGGQGSVGPGDVLTVHLLLRAYYVLPHDLTLGKHTISFKMGVAESNTIAINVSIHAGVPVPQYLTR